MGNNSSTSSINIFKNNTGSINIGGQINISTGVVTGVNNSVGNIFVNGENITASVTSNKADENTDGSINSVESNVNNVNNVNVYNRIKERIGSISSGNIMNNQGMIRINNGEIKISSKSGTITSSIDKTTVMSGSHGIITIDFRGVSVVGNSSKLNIFDLLDKIIDPVISSRTSDFQKDKVSGTSVVGNGNIIDFGVTSGTSYGSSHTSVNIRGGINISGNNINVIQNKVIYDGKVIYVIKDGEGVNIEMKDNKIFCNGTLIYDMNKE